MAKLTANVNVVSRCTQMQRGQRLKSLGLCGGQVMYLLRLNRCPGLTQEEIARALYLNKSTVARQITNLEKSGFVERRADPDDRRCQRVYLTQKALDAMPEIRKCVNDWSEYLLEGFTGEEREALLSMMDRLSERARAYIEREVGWDA